MEVTDELEAALRAPNWSATFAHIHNVVAALTTQSAEIERLQGEVERLENENKTLRHWAWGHIDALLLYAAGSYPKDSHVKDAVAFCRLLYPKRTLRMDPLEESAFHPACTTLGTDHDRS